MKDLQSQTISFLRFPLIVGVLFIHNSTSQTNIMGIEYGTDAASLPVFYWCSNFFSGVLASISVPLFFFIAGFLFFLNVSSFNRNIYGKKLRTRAKTLLVPYLLWNLLTIGRFLISNSVFTHSNGISLQNILSSLWVLPAAYQFWFIRDLMVTVILTPIIYVLCKRTKLYGVILPGIWWFFGWWDVEIPGLSNGAISFFIAGACLSINKRNLIDDMGKVKQLSFVLYPAVALADLFTKQYAFNTFINQTGIIVGIVFSINFAAFLLKTGKLKVNEFLSAASFFVFAVHALMLTCLRTIAFAIFNVESDIAITSFYFLNVILVALVALALYYVLRRFVPKFTNIITGGR